MLPTLIVDSDEKRKQIYQKMLQRSFKISSADTFKEGLEFFLRDKPLLVLIVADLEDGQGIALVKQIRQLKSGSSAKILLAGKDLNDEILGADTARKLGADDLIQLPYKPDKLRQKIKTLVQQLIAQRNGKKEQAAKTTVKAPDALKNQAFKKPAKITFKRPLVETLKLDLSKEFAGISAENIAAIGEEKLIEIASLYQQLDKTDYYALLGVLPATNAGVIRKSFFKLSKDYHPDRYAIVGNAQLSKKVAKIFKCMSEAYQVILKPEKRKAYDEILAKDEGLRLLTKSRENEGPKRVDASITNPQARKFYNLAVSSIGEGNYSAAKINLSLALSMAPNDATIVAKMAEVEKKLQ